jgi:hypothetical protein
MAQTIATISLCIFIVLIQHLFNWLFRKSIEMMEHDETVTSYGLFVGGTALTFILTSVLFKLLIEINK